MYAHGIGFLQNPFFQAAVQISVRVEKVIDTLKDIALVNFSAYYKPEVPRIKKNLVVKPLESKKEIIQLKELANNWKNLADEKALKSSLLLPNLIKSNLPQFLYPHCDDDDIFKSSSDICDKISKLNRGFKAFVCCTNEPGIENIVSIAIVRITTSSLSIELLASHPNNIFSPLNNQVPDRPVGAAKMMIEHFAEKVCPELDLSTIELHAVKSSRNFYKKMGFSGHGFMVLYLNKK